MKNILFILWFVFLGWVCWNTYQPFLAVVRPWMSTILTTHILMICFYTLQHWHCHREKPSGRRSNPSGLPRHHGFARAPRNDGIPILFTILFLFVTSLWLYQNNQHENAKKIVLNANPLLLQELGRHFIVGYRDFEEVRHLVERGAIGGIYITHRNIRGKTLDEVKKEIATLQSIQINAGRQSLFIAADQEGGLVSHLSPLLTRLPPLGKIIQGKKGDELRQVVKNYASIQGKELSELGVNLNLGPVVDLQIPLPQFEDKHSLISQRALSSNPHIISEVGRLYCEVIYQWGVMSTLKHFPGLGRVTGDSHFKTLQVPVDLSVLEKEDWLPFQEILKTSSNTALMVSHVIVPQVDSHNPASVSEKMIRDILRNQFQFKGLILTDDFSMGPIVSRVGGVGKASLDALNAGIDEILISYDSDLYYPAMAYLIENSRRQLTHLTSSYSRKFWFFRVQPRT